MFAVLMITSGLLASRQETPATKHADPAILDELIERSGALESFSATYRIGRSDESKSGKLRFDFRAPDRLRMDMEAEGPMLSSWSLADVLVVRGEKDGKPSGMRIDSGPIYAELQPIVDELERVFPVAKSPFARRASVVLMTWSVNPTTRVLDYNLTVGNFDGAQSPFGWLTTLRSKHVDFVEDGEHLSCSTDDGRVDVVISRTTGVLEKFVGRRSDSPVTMTIELESLAIDQPIDAQRFEVPAFAEDPQAAAQNLKQMARTAHGRVRAQLWQRSSNACTSATVEPELRSKFETTLRPLHELRCHAQYDEWMTKSRENMSAFAADCVREVEAGTPEDEIERHREKARSGWITVLDKAEASYASALEMPASAATAGCAPQLLSIEHELTTAVFRDLVRQPLLDEFDRATKTD